MVRKVEEKLEIATILNKYEDILDHFINSSDTEFPDYPDFSD